MLMSSAAIFAVVCLQLGVTQPFNEFHLSTNGQNSDWYRNNDVYNYNGGIKDWHQSDYHGSERPEYKMCPPSMDEVGRATWVFMHSVAAMYPENPTPEQQNQMRQLMELINQFYPNAIHHLYYSSVMHNKPDTTSRRNLTEWMCRVHNDVNVKMGKPEFDCSYTDERWRDGSCN